MFGIPLSTKAERKEIKRKKLKTTTTYYGVLL